MTFRFQKSDCSDENEANAAPLLGKLILVTWGAYLVAFCVALYYGDRMAQNVSLVGGLLQFIPYWLLHRRQWLISSWALSLCVLGTVTLLATFGQGYRDLALTAFPVILVFSSLALNRWLFVYNTVWTLACTAWLVFGPMNGWFVPLPFIPNTYVTDFLLLSVILLVTAFAVDLLVTNIRARLDVLQTEIAQRRQAEEALRESERKFKSIFDHATVGIFQTSAEGTFISLNPAIVRTLGYASLEELIEHTKNLSSSMYASLDDRNRLLARLKEHGSVQNHELEMRRKDGTLIWGSMSVHAEKDENGEVRYFEGTVNDISERKRAEEALVQSEQKFRYLYDNAMEGMFRTSIGGKALMANQSLASILGYVSPEEYLRVMNDSAQQVWNDAKDRSTFLALLEKQGCVQGYECQMKRQDGTLIWLSLNARLVRDEKGKNLYTDGFVIDITNRKQAEMEIVTAKERAEASELKLQGMLDTMLDAFFQVDLHGMITFANPAAVSLYRYSSIDEMIGIPASTFYAVKEERDELIAELRKSGKKVDWRGKGLRKDGTTFWASMNAQVIRDKNGDIIGTRGVARDISESKMAEEALLSTQSLLGAIVEGTDDFIWSVDPEQFGLLTFNSRLANNFLKARGIHVKNGMTPGDLYPKPEFVQIWNELYQRALREGRYITEYRGHTGPHTMELNFNVLKRDGVVVCISVFGRDITERKKSEEEKSRLEEQLQQSQKMESIGTLAGGIAHDFNNILAGIIGFTELALETSQNEQQTRHLQEAQKGAERAATLVGQILTFSRQNVQEKRPLELRPLLKEAIKFLRASIPATIEICQDLTDEHCSILADSTQMHQVIMNLCTNASHAMKKTGGTLSIKLSVIELTERETVQYHDLRPGSFVRLTVSDTGHGIEPGHLQRIFDPFFTTKSKNEGTGLGLSVVYGIVKNHDGVITVQSEPGKGANFTVYLPRIIQNEVKTQSVLFPVIGGTERILVVDDEPALVALVTLMLTSLGYEVTGVASCEEALASFQAEPRRFHLVITDMTLPKMTGLELSQQLMSIRPDIPIILCSGFCAIETEEKAKALGIKAFCKKPITKRALARVIREILDPPGAENPR